MSITLNDLYQLIQEGNKELKREIKEFRSDVNRELEHLKISNIKLEKENEELKHRLLHLERKARKYNLIIYGIEGNEKETRDNVLKLLHKLQIKCTLNDFREVHRIGKEIEGKNRPVAIEVVNYQLKLDILTNAKKNSYELKGKNIFFSHDYCPEDYQKRKFLGEQLKAAKEKHYLAFIKGDILSVNGEEYSYEMLKNGVEIEQIYTEKPAAALRNHSAPSTPTLTPAIEDISNEQPLKADEKKQKLDPTITKSIGSKTKINTRSQKEVQSQSSV